jgi:hypothetical protein
METQKVKKVHAEDLHFEHKLWANQLSFNKEELSIFQNRLDELARHNNQIDVTIKIEQFQNKLSIQTNHLEKLKHDIQRSEQHLAAIAQKNVTAFDHKLFEDHQEERAKMETFTALYADFRKEFYKFVGENL